MEGSWRTDVAESDLWLFSLIFLRSLVNNCCEPQETGKRKYCFHLQQYSRGWGSRFFSRITQNLIFRSTATCLKWCRTLPLDFPLRFWELFQILVQKNSEGKTAVSSSKLPLGRFPRLFYSSIGRCARITRRCDAGAMPAFTALNPALIWSQL